MSRRRPEPFWNIDKILGLTFLTTEKEKQPFECEGCK